MFRRFFPIAAHGLLFSLLLPAVASAQAPSPSAPASAVPGPASSQPKQSSLMVLNARKAALIGHTLALDGVTPPRSSSPTGRSAVPAISIWTIC
ncbi:MAG: hypothetical protein J0H44_00540 [Alphaproteobacteria bacterium]|nr:hypothetical protein [Alphaproteobacteria bacterium]